MPNGSVVRVLLRSAVLPLALAAVAAPSFAQGAKIAVIDSNRIVEESVAGKAALTQLSSLRDAKLESMRALRQEIADGQKRYDEGRLSLTEERLAEMQKDLQDKAVQLKRLQEDAERELEKQQREALKKIENRVLAIIEQVGKEQGYTLIFNKFQAGLVFADDAIDITDVILQRFDAAGGS
jgi:outer membrane protein